ncbi:MAG: SDR family NAD(P)-dependent oxidoreductase, partial [Novosphingobium sp.]|nr:SDR family NAD(P)-dependent oxidoreductase [Novosphingobium sp.]
MRLEGKIAVITGAGSGMGKAMAQRFTEEGAKVVLADISGKQDEVAAAINGAAKAVGVNDVRAVPVHANVANEDDVRNM